MSQFQIATPRESSNDLLLIGSIMEWSVTAIQPLVG
jgi:hypothetical protein